MSDSKLDDAGIKLAQDILEKIRIENWEIDVANYMTTDLNVIAEVYRLHKESIKPKTEKLILQPQVNNRRQYKLKKELESAGIAYEYVITSVPRRETRFDLHHYYKIDCNPYGILRGFKGVKGNWLSPSRSKYLLDWFTLNPNFVAGICPVCNRVVEDMRYWVVQHGLVPTCRSCRKRGVKCVTVAQGRAMLSAKPPVLRSGYHSQAKQRERLVALLGDPPQCPYCRQTIPLPKDSPGIGRRWVFRKNFRPACKRCWCAGEKHSIL